MTVPDVVDLRPLNKIFIPGNPNPTTRWRWVMRGVSQAEGARIRLKVWYVANRPFTTDAAVSEFLLACTNAQMKRSRSRTGGAAEPSEAELREVGL